MKADRTPAGTPDGYENLIDPDLGELLHAFHVVESTARQLREFTLTTSTAGAVKAVHREPSPELVELLERFEGGVERLLTATGAESLPEAREVARSLQRRRHLRRSD